MNCYVSVSVARTIKLNIRENFKDNDCFSKRLKSDNKIPAA